MELVLKNVSYYYKNKKLLKNISFTLSDSYIYGITGEYKTLLLELIDDLKKYEGEISLSGLTNKNKNEYRKNICLIKQNNNFMTNKVIEEMNFIISNLNYKHSDIDKKRIDALNMVGLDKSYLNREIHTLSTSEKTLISIACNLLVNPKVIILDEVFKKLDLIGKKRVLDLIRRFKNNYNKIVIISSNDVNFLYQYTDNMIVLNNGSLSRIDDTSKLFLDTKYLNNNNIEIPYLVDFTEKARNKKIRLMYHKDILDLIKDVYKHV